VTPPIILRGRWSDTVQKTGNYVFRLAGNLSAEVVHSFGPILCSIFPGEASIVPTRGWTWIQLRGVDVEYLENNVGYAYDEQDLIKAFRTNPCFANAVVPVPPYWQGNPLNFTKATSTVIVAVLDEDNSICQQASQEGVCMFGRQIKFVRAGDHPSLIQCARCHELGHNASSPKCSTPRDQHRCYVCGKGHQSQHHSFECASPHKAPGHCDCVPRCLLCKQSGHTARDKGCPRCYGRLAVVSDLDDGGVCPECRQEVERICRAITKQVQRSDARIEVDVMHTWNECTVLRFAKRGPTWTRILWMQPLMT
jgi:hypothetical protein